MDDFVTLLDADGIRRALSRISYEIVERAGVLTDVVLVGIRTRGWYIAQRLAKRVADIEHVEVPYFALDISRYRDDRKERPDASTNSDLLPERINEKRVVLIDDVLFTGRTARAGLDALTDGARPARIQLAVLVDRGHRELPIRPDYIGKNIPTARSERVDVRLTETDGEDIVRLRK